MFETRFEAKTAKTNLDLFTGGPPYYLCFFCNNSAWNLVVKHVKKEDTQSRDQSCSNEWRMKKIY
jgi:hypothetical protein